MTRLRRFAEKHDILIPSAIAVLIAFMDISGLPLQLFLDVHVADVAPAYIALLANVLLASLLCVLLTKALYRDWPFRLRGEGIGRGLARYGAPGLIAFAASLLAFHLGLIPYDNSPTAVRVIVEVFLYYSGVALIEELFVRGLLLNICRKLLEKKRNGLIWAVLLSSALFGLGHIPGSLAAPPFITLCKVVWTIGMGVYLAAVYIKSDNLWCAIILHAIIDFAALPYCFSTATGYPAISLIILLPLYIILGACGVVMLRDGQGRNR